MPRSLTRTRKGLRAEGKARTFGSASPPLTVRGALPPVKGVGAGPGQLSGVSPRCYVPRTAEMTVAPPFRTARLVTMDVARRRVSTAGVATIDFHVTSDCSQSCPYCWGPQGFQRPVDTPTALRIVDGIREVGATRVVFTGGDPLRRPDLSALVGHAKGIGLEVAVSTTGDELDEAFLEACAGSIDLISLPLDGPTEEISAGTKEPGHFGAVMRALVLLRAHPEIDVKVCTPVTRFNLDAVPDIARLVEEYAETTRARVFYNVFQAYPRAMFSAEWDSLLVTHEEFADLQRRVGGGERVRIHFLGHETLDRLYAMIFPDGNLVVPSGPDYTSLGPFLEIDDLGAALAASAFDSAKHLRHSRGWSKAEGPPGPRPSPLPATDT
jgi:MoaA/NifB/PqqE/SkfB family radical SAM enzyme